MIDFMNGVQYISGGEFRWWDLVGWILVLITMIFAFAFLCALLYIAIKEKDKETLPEAILIAIIIGINTPITINKLSKIDERHYTVKIEEGVDMEEFLDRYTIIKEESNKTIVIKERSGDGAGPQAIPE